MLYLLERSLREYVSRADWQYVERDLTEGDPLFTAASLAQSALNRKITQSRGRDSVMTARKRTVDSFLDCDPKKSTRVATAYENIGYQVFQALDRQVTQSLQQAAVNLNRTYSVRRSRAGIRLVVEDASGNITTLRGARERTLFPDSIMSDVPKGIGFGTRPLSTDLGPLDEDESLIALTKVEETGTQAQQFAQDMLQILK